MWQLLLQSLPDAPNLRKTIVSVLRSYEVLHTTSFICNESVRFAPFELRTMLA